MACRKNLHLVSSYRRTVSIKQAKYGFSGELFYLNGTNQSLLELGIEIEDRQKLLAHASTTTKIYTHPNFDLEIQYVNQVPKFDGLV